MKSTSKFFETLSLSDYDFEIIKDIFSEYSIKIVPGCDYLNDKDENGIVYSDLIKKSAA